VKIKRFDQFRAAFLLLNIVLIIGALCRLSPNQSKFPAKFRKKATDSFSKSIHSKLEDYNKLERGYFGFSVRAT
jgi:hypothetical protein